MKIFIGAGFTALLAIGAIVCPEHVRQQARDAATIPPAVHAEISRQLDLFVSVMEGERPAIEPASSR
jgi:hypothetical protein